MAQLPDPHLDENGSPFGFMDVSVPNPEAWGPDDFEDEYVGTLLGPDGRVLKHITNPRPRIGFARELPS